MRGQTVAASYAATLFELGRRRGAERGYGDALALVAQLLGREGDVRTFLETPRIADSAKKQVMRKVFADVMPEHVLNFLLVVIDRGRQGLLSAMSQSYQTLLDQHLGREHVQVTLAREVDAHTRDAIKTHLSALLGKEAIPHVSVRPEIMGGIVVRTGDVIYDGSVRGRLKRLRRHLLAAPIARPLA